MSIPEVIKQLIQIYSVEFFSVDLHNYTSEEFVL